MIKGQKTTNTLKSESLGCLKAELKWKAQALICFLFLWKVCSAHFYADFFFSGEYGKKYFSKPKWPDLNLPFKCILGS